MSGSISSISNPPESFSSQGSTSSESSRSASSKSSGSASNKSSSGTRSVSAVRRISLPSQNSSERASKKTSLARASAPFNADDKIQHKISTASTSSVSSSKSSSTQNKKSDRNISPTSIVNLSPTSAAEGVSEKILEPYTPLLCSKEELKNVTFKDYKNFSSNSNIENDDLIVFEEVGFTTRSAASLVSSTENITPEEKKLTEDKNKIIAENNKTIKADFSKQVREEFGDRIADYFLLSALHQAYFQSEAPLTAGVVRSVLKKAEEAKTFVEKYTQEHIELPEEVANVMGHGAFLEQEAKAALQELEKLGFPADLLEEVRAHNAEFLKEAGINTAIVGGVSAAMITGLSFSFWMIPARLTTTVPAAMAFAYSRTANTTSSTSSNAAVVLTRAIPISIIAPIQAAFLNVAYAHSLLLALPLAPLAIAASATNYPMMPAQYVISSLRDCKTPWDKSCASTVALAQSNTRLEETIAIQREATATYKEALSMQENLDFQKQEAQKNSEQALTTRSSASSNAISDESNIIREQLMQSQANVQVLKEKRVKSVPYSSFRASNGRPRAQF